MILLLLAGHQEGGITLRIAFPTELVKKKDFLWKAYEFPELGSTGKEDMKGLKHHRKTGLGGISALAQPLEFIVLGLRPHICCLLISWHLSQSALF